MPAESKQKFLRYYQNMHLCGFGAAIYDIGDPSGRLRVAIEKRGGRPLYYELMTLEQLTAFKGNNAGKLAQLIERVSNGEIDLSG